MEESNFLTKDLLLQRDDLKIEKVELTRGYVFVREMTGSEKDRWEQSMLKQKPNGNKNAAVEYETTLEDFRAKLAVVTMCDADGNLLFEAKDIKALNKAMSATNMEKIVEVAQRLNAISQKDKDEILKNSEADPEDSSSSDSAEN
ncbi:MAG: hypothetical protein M0R17_06550 [Candidatus Omnitrophica bacterium]|jgi:hypothetical protein|nr:hypothetical protein [Candidatus Omnitrophota bacterium]